MSQLYLVAVLAAWIAGWPFLAIVTFVYVIMVSSDDDDDLV